MDIPHDLSGRVEATCQWLESGTSVFTTDMAHDIRARIAELEAENVRQKATIEAQSAIIKQADEALAARDRMLHFCIERIALTPERWNGWTTNEVLADLRARAEEGSEK